MTDAGARSVAARRCGIGSSPDCRRPMRPSCGATWRSLCSRSATSRRAGQLRLPTDPAAALADLFLPGRFQAVLTDPDWIVDTAHNAQALEHALRTFAARPCRGRRIVLLGAMHDKPAPPQLGAWLRPFTAVTAAVVSLPRSRNREAWQGLFGEWGFTDPATHSVMDSVGAALEYWRARLRAEDAVLVTGSCFMVAEALHRLGFADLEATRRPKPAAGRVLR